ncbi:hypothetical protein [Tropicimonas sp. IMCC6043]|uniref:hypothetical protein n=1 Tax=Tropicimonas sp. IMCC6043 TaxID=2510645 RepID=UPI00101C7ABB|nr:hypothetical protein [Tropicimonas sp. IMCC6043]RYH06517.1 hypothetical protein EU800_23550 [Tropicimonas sp. IMCC6043]
MKKIMIAALAIMPPAPAPADSFKGTGLEIVDYDTIRTPGGAMFSLRNAPKITDPEEQELAEDFLRELLADREVSCEFYRGYGSCYILPERTLSDYLALPKDKRIAATIVIPGTELEGQFEAWFQERVNKAYTDIERRTSELDARQAEIAAARPDLAAQYAELQAKQAEIERIKPELADTEWQVCFGKVVRSASAHLGLDVFSLKDGESPMVQTNMTEDETYPVEVVMAKNRPMIWLNHPFGDDLLELDFTNGRTVSFKSKELNINSVSERGDWEWIGQADEDRSLSVKGILYDENEVPNLMRHFDIKIECIN